MICKDESNTLHCESGGSVNRNDYPDHQQWCLAVNTLTTRHHVLPDRPCQAGRAPVWCIGLWGRGTFHPHTTAPYLQLPLSTHCICTRLSRWLLSQKNMRLHHAPSAILTLQYKAVVCYCTNPLCTAPFNPIPFPAGPYLIQIIMTLPS